jgi:2-succinyl-5-enolpyruvyl-6-hydroxy-3-cyclohexene-1-carboxylate synthase
MRPGQTLISAASNPVRDLDLAGGALPDGVSVIANRGLSGIDGTVSTALGHVLASGRPGRLLTGDLALLHDLGALAAAPGEARPQLQIVVVNDRGGGIFSLLEYGELAERDADQAQVFERLFATPQQADLAALCRGHGVPYRRIETVDGLESVLAQPDPGVSVVEVPAGRSGLRRLHAAVRDAVAAATGLIGTADPDVEAVE